ncbi:MAG: hypothetical protein JWL88_761 [Parcubacteria group bacterium]|nr:hypothetical protein [Parcubacteria group bacterium]
MKRTGSLVTIGVIVIAAMLGAWGLSAFIKEGSKIANPAPIVATTTLPDTTSTVPVTKPGIPVPTPTTHAYGTVTLSLGEVARFAGVTIAPLSIIQDSRCPVGVQCIQAGTVQVSVRITPSSDTNVQTLTLGKMYSAPAGTIILTSVTPDKHEGNTISPSDYRLTFDVEKQQPVAAGKCFVGGCSSEVCSDQPNAVSNCLYTAAFACYRSATCERQSTGQCGWTQTPALQSCLANPPQ